MGLASMNAFVHVVGQHCHLVISPAVLPRQGAPGGPVQQGQSTVALAVPQLGSCTPSGRAWWPRAARHSRGGPRPLGSQPPPQLLALAASKVAYSTAFNHPGLAAASRGEPTPTTTGRVYAERVLRL